MRLIIIEDAVYKVSDKIFKKINAKNLELEKQERYQGKDIEMSDFLEDMKSEFKFIDRVSFHFCL